MKTIKKLLSIFVIITSLSFVSCENEVIDPSLLNQEELPPVNSSVLPVLTSTTITSITSTSAFSGGTITSDGGSSVTSRGVVWSTSQNPTIANSKTINGNGVGNFVSSISGLTANTTYYVRAYATNVNGTAYGNQLSLTTSGSGGGGGGGSTGFAMTAKINGVQFQANNPFGNNQFSSTNIWSYFPQTDYVMLQGRQGGLLGNPEINIWLKRTQIVVGTYPIGKETYTTPPSHFIDLTDNVAAGFEETVQGSITITEVNLTTKTVKGTFQFTTSDDVNPATPVINNTVTNGTFNYVYMN